MSREDWHIRRFLFKFSILYWNNIILLFCFFLLFIFIFILHFYFFEMSYFQKLKKEEKTKLYGFLAIYKNI